MSRSRLGVRLEAPGEQASLAEEFLYHWEGTEAWLEHAIRCPECQSFRVDFPQFTEKSIFTNLTMGLIAELGFIERQYYCEDCHFMWSRSGSRLIRIREHMAPNYFLEDISGQGQIRRLHAPFEGAGQPPPARLNSKPLNRCSRAAGRNPVERRWFPMAGLIAVLGTLGQLRAAGPAVTHFAVGLDQPAQAVWKAPTYCADVLPIFMGKCARCHNDQSILANWLDYKTASAKRWAIKRRVWDSWRGAYFKEPMPVPNGPESEAITETERQLIRDWVESGARQGVVPIYDQGLTKPEKIEVGRRLFTTICAACHQPRGQGISERFPPLAGSDFLNADKYRAIKIVVNGLQGELVVNGQRFNNAMPKFPLTDRDIACALTFVYNSFGNSGKEVSPDEVRAVRNEKEAPQSVPVSTAKAPDEKSPYE
ncbi:MAG TPA: c-type cytochrome [Terriglobia bacterium]|nr:c-type cytochrome [Terriglobia bacterium]